LNQEKKMKKFYLALLTASALTSPVYAGEVSITWQTPEKYTDIRPSSETREAFQERVTKELGEVLPIWQKITGRCEVGDYGHRC
jgi:hypothetical protein